jgi:hypothetical protein
MFVLSLHAGHTDTHKINCHFYSFFFVMKTTDFAINPLLIYNVPVVTSTDKQ